MICCIFFTHELERKLLFAIFSSPGCSSAAANLNVKMSWKLSTCLAIVLILQTASCLEDLLDQYVRHVEVVNRIPPDSANQRYRRRTVSDQIKDSNKFYYGNAGFHGVHRAKRDTGNNYELYQWTHAEVLDRRGDVVLRWQPRHQEILFRVEARTRGYVGIGFSPDGGMEGADIVLGWVDDRTGQGYLLVSCGKALWCCKIRSILRRLTINIILIIFIAVL